MYYDSALNLAAAEKDEVTIRRNENKNGGKKGKRVQNNTVWLRTERKTGRRWRAKRFKCI